MLCFSLCPSLLNAANSDTGITYKGFSLADCYEMSLKNNPALLAKNQVVKESEGRYRQAVGTSLPQVSFSALYLRQGVDTSVNLPQTFGAENSYQDKFSLFQPIFTGFQEYNAISAIKAERIQRASEELRARQAVLSAVSDSFYNQLELEDTLKVYNEITLILKKRTDELAKRIKVGRSRKSELSSTMALFYQNEGHIETTKNRLANEKKQMEYLTGSKDIDTLNDTVIYPGSIDPIDKYSALAAARPDVLAAQQAAFIAKKQTSIAKGGYLPSLGLNANYYTAQSGRFSGINWDASLEASLPLLPVVQTAGRVDEANARLREAELFLEQTKKDALLDIDTAYNNMQYALSGRTAFDTALKAAKENYNLQSEDYRSNLISNLDLLESIRSLYDAMQDNLHAVYEVKRAYFRLLSSTGSISY